MAAPAESIVTQSSDSSPFNPSPAFPEPSENSLFSNQPAADHTEPTKNVFEDAEILAEPNEGLSLEAPAASVGAVQNAGKVSRKVFTCTRVFFLTERGRRTVPEQQDRARRGGA